MMLAVTVVCVQCAVCLPAFKEWQKQQDIEEHMDDLLRAALERYLRHGEIPPLTLEKPALKERQEQPRPDPELFGPLDPRMANGAGPVCVDRADLDRMLSR